jgi:hypothetical protein
MKKLVLLALVGFVWFVSLFGVNFYSLGSSPTYYVNNTSSWNSQRNGSGYPPSNFTTAGQVFYVQNGHSLTATAQWTVSGTGSYVIVENGGTIITGAYNHQITGTVKNGGTYEVNHTTYSNLGWGGNGYLEDTSNFVLNNSGISFNDNVSYGNLIVTSGTADCSGSTAGFEVRGTLLVNGGIFEGAQTTEDQVLSIANIYVQSGTFFGSAGGANATYNNLINLTVAGGTFLGSYGSGVSTYNISGDVLISSGAFYGSYRNNYDLASNIYNIGGSFTKTGGYYYAVNVVQGGYPTYNLSGVGKSFGLGDVSGAYGRHMINVSPGASYTLSNNVPLYTGMQCEIRGTINASSYQFKATGTSAVFRIYGTIKTPNTDGLCWSATTTFANTNSPAVDIWAGSGYEGTIEYTSNSSQTVTPRTDYQYLSFSGSGTKTISSTTSVAKTLTVNSPVTLDTGITLNINGAMSGTSTISGGNVVIGVAGDQLQLRSLNVNNLTLNSSRGAKMYANVQTGNLTLSQGTFNIDAFTLTITGTKSGSGTLTGGGTSYLTLSGSGGDFSLPSGFVLHTLTNYRTASISMGGNLTLVNLSLQNGTFSIGSNTLTITGSITGSGTWSGGTTSNLTIGGAGVFDLPAGLVLHTLSTSRSPGTTMNGNLSLVNLNIPIGTLTVGANTLSVSGSMSWISGILSTVTSSIIEMTNGSVDGNICPISRGTLTINRSGRTCYLGGNTNLNTLNLNAGTLSIGANTLTIVDALYANGGSLLGGTTSNLTINATVTAASIPSVTLQTYTQLNDLVYLTGSMEVTNLSLQSGTLNLGTSGLTVAQFTLPPDIGKSTPLITGSTSSWFTLNLNQLLPVELPQFNVGGLNVNTAATCRVSVSSGISTQLSLTKGQLDPNGLLSLSPGVSISRNIGSLASAPGFSNGHRINYLSTLTTGWELPDEVVAITVMGGGAIVQANKDISLLQHLIIGPNCSFDLNGHTLYLDPGAQIMGDNSASLFGNVVKDIADGGFSSPATGLNIGSGVEISNFSFNQQPESQSHGGNQGILRTWTLEGEFDGSVTLSLSWNPTADNGIVFSPLNRAIVYCKVGGSWQQVGDPQDVSLLVPRIVTVNTSHFSDWTVGSEDEVLPVELSSFTAATNWLNTVTLNWVTQSETGMQGYYLFRSTEASFPTATQICQLIPACNNSTLQTYSYTDNEVLTNQTYYYWLQSVELSGGVTTYDYLTVHVNAPGNEPDTPPIPSVPLSIYPNPFNPNLSIKIYQSTSADIDLRVYDTRGRLVKVIASGHLDKGSYSYTWDSLDSHSQACASGVYLISYKSGTDTHLQKMTLLK